MRDGRLKESAWRMFVMRKVILYVVPLDGRIYMYHGKLLLRKEGCC